jgi:thiol-disulfide isomerase/thioredoxin
VRPRRGLALAVLGLLAACGGAERFRPLEIGAAVPALRVRTLTGDSASVGPGEPVTLVNIWATWCIPCQQEFPDLERLHREFGTRGLRVLAVSVDQSDDAPVRRFAEEYGATFLIGHDPSGDIKFTYQAIGVPATYLVDAHGRLLARQMGAISYAGFKPTVERALRR